VATVFSALERQERFVPEIWISEVFMAKEAELIVGSSLVVNRDYEGDIQRAGDTVRIPTILDPTVTDYDPITGIVGDPEENTGDSLTFEIEVAKMFTFRVEDITRVQSQIGTTYMPHGVQRAGRKLAEASDAWVAAKIAAAVTSATPERYLEIDLSATGTPDKLYKQIVGLKVALDKTNTPMTGRFLIVSPDVYGVLLQDARFIDASQYGGNAPIRNGEVGRILGFTVVMCNVMPDATGTPTGTADGKVVIIAGHNIATTYADQIVEVEYYRPEKFFADAVRGLHVYGSKVMRPEHLALGINNADA
jgi:N4-gp56 family major capsid protein